MLGDGGTTTPQPKKGNIGQNVLEFPLFSVTCEDPLFVSFFFRVIWKYPRWASSLDFASFSVSPFPSRDVYPPLVSARFALS